MQGAASFILKPPFPLHGGSDIANVFSVASPREVSDTQLDSVKGWLL